MVELLGGEVPGQLDEHVMDVLDNDLMLAVLCRPDAVQVLHAKHLLLDAEAHDAIQLLHVLGLVEVVSEHDGQYVVLLDPRLNE